ncbi:hypothetical protein NDU88_005314 [Pleurodeles waltl]|uniref:Uncharacterized protein n=1 Tax=Pleurodeles waltl TaxID=8319 RepID=A0AAV7TV34_PLEWA|nr:hypothetical protein NDU88_005314 [Pleurodeles waltl]
MMFSPCHKLLELNGQHSHIPNLQHVAEDHKERKVAGPVPGVTCISAPWYSGPHSSAHLIALWEVGTALNEGVGDKVTGAKWREDNPEWAVACGLFAPYKHASPYPNGTGRRDYTRTVATHSTCCANMFRNGLRPEGFCYLPSCFPTYFFLNGREGGDRATQLADFFQTLPLASLPMTHREAFEAPLDSEEIHQALCQLARNKRPGSDGLPAEYDHTFTPQLIKP